MTYYDSNIYPACYLIRISKLLSIGYIYSVFYWLEFLIKEIKPLTKVFPENRPSKNIRGEELGNWLPSMAIYQTAQIATNSAKKNYGVVAYDLLRVVVTYWKFERWLVPYR